MQTSGFNAELGRQQFLDLLVTQLQHQDPLEPVGQQEFIEQLAQFSVVEGVEQLNMQFEDFLKIQTLADGADFVGRHIEYEASDGSTQTGQVSEARVINGQLSLTVGEAIVPLHNIAALIAQSQ